MAQQYQDNGMGSPSDDYAELSGYYQANKVPSNSLLTFNIYPEDAKYFDLNRKTNMKVPNFKPRSYNTLEGPGQYTPYAENFKSGMMNGKMSMNSGNMMSGRKEGFRVISPQVYTAGGSVINNKYEVGSKDDS